MEHPEDMIHDYREGNRNEVRGVKYDSYPYEFYCRRCDRQWGEPMFYSREGADEYSEMPKWCYHGDHEAYDQKAIDKEGWEEEDEEE